MWQAVPGPWEGGGLTKKQLGALERISEHMEAAGRNVIDEAQLGRHRNTSALELGAPGRTMGATGRAGGTSSAIPSLPVEGVGGSISAPGGMDWDVEGGVRPGAIPKLPRAKDIRPHVNMTKAGMRRRKPADNLTDAESFRPLHPIIISRRFNRAKDDLQRTLKIPPVLDRGVLTKFHNANHAVPARDLGVLPNTAGL